MSSAAPSPALSSELFSSTAEEAREEARALAKEAAEEARALEIIDEEARAKGAVWDARALDIIDIAEVTRDKARDLETGDAELFGVLNRGFVRLVDSMGSDAAIVQAARVSYGKGTKKTREDRALIRYLMRHRHNSPFEMCELKLHVKLPIFVARQWVRHRTASLNEYSARYSEMSEEFYVPNEPGKALFPEEEARLGKQSQENRQGRSEDETFTIKQDEGSHLPTRRLKDRAHNAFTFYRELLKQGVTRELARITLPLSTYTEFYWKANLHNMFHFLELRMDSHAQEEIRLYAETIFEKIVRPLFPQASEAFKDYRLESLDLSRGEAALLRALVKGGEVARPAGGFSEREWKTFLKSFSLKERGEG